AISLLREQTNNPYLKFVLRKIYEELKEGGTLSVSLEKYPNIFPGIYIALVRAGENTGNLAEVLFRITDYRKREEEFLSRVRMSLVYPVFMAVLGIITVIFMFIFVIPRLTQIFLSMQETLPLPTRILISLSGFFRRGTVFVLFLIFMGIIFLRRELKRNLKLGFSYSKFKLNLPIFGRFLLKAELSRFCRALAILIKNGIPIIKAMELAVPTLNNELLKEEIKKSISALVQGGSFGRTLKESKHIPLFMSNLISIGEEAGELDLALLEIAEVYEQDTYETMQAFTNLLEPLLILVLGLVIGFIVIAMLLPIFQMSALK
ncbi:MAG: type II secretion system F family protein, partial [Candidatus Omnitrophica bacterium]|nr:type II secretion system F family protein [Candidatus Omnitrophota bacterium]